MVRNFDPYSSLYTSVKYTDNSRIKKSLGESIHHHTQFQFTQVLDVYIFFLFIDLKTSYFFKNGLFVRDSFKINTLDIFSATTILVISL